MDNVIPFPITPKSKPNPRIDIPESRLTFAEIQQQYRRSHKRLKQSIMNGKPNPLEVDFLLGRLDLLIHSLNMRLKIIENQP